MRNNLLLPRFFYVSLVGTLTLASCMPAESNNDEAQQSDELALFAQNAGSVASFNGTLSNPAQEDHIAFNVDNTSFQSFNGRGAVDLVFVMTGVQTSGTALDPGLISIDVKERRNWCSYQWGTILTTCNP